MKNKYIPPTYYLLGCIGALVVLTIVYFGTNKFSNPEYVEISMDVVNDKHVKSLVIAQADAATEESKENVAQDAGKTDVTLFGGKPAAWFLLCSIFEAQGNLACGQGHYDCGYGYDCDASQWALKVPNTTNGDAIGAFQFDYQYWGQENIIEYLIEAFPQDFMEFKDLITNPELSQRSDIALALHNKLCVVRDRDWKDLMDVEALCAYNSCLKPALKGLEQLTDGAVTEENIHPALGAAMLSCSIRLNANCFTKDGRVNSKKAALQDKIKASGGKDQREIIELIYDFLYNYGKSDSHSRYGKERIIALDMYDNPDFDIYACRNKDNNIVEWSYSRTGFGHCLGMEGY